MITGGMLRNVLRDFKSPAALKGANDNFQSIWMFLSKCITKNEFKFVMTDLYDIEVLPDGTKFYTTTVSIPVNTTVWHAYPTGIFTVRTGAPQISVYVPNNEYLNYATGSQTIKDWSLEGVSLSNWDTSKPSKVTLNVFGK